MISYNGTQYTTATDTFHQLIDGANVFGFNFYQAEDALTMNQAIQNAILDLTIIASTPATPVSASGPPPPPPMPSQAALAALGSKDQADNDSNSKNNSFASSLAGAKLKKSPSVTPAASINEQSRQPPVAAGGGGGLMSEMQMKLNKRKDPAAVAPAADKQQSAPAQVDFRSQLKAKTAAVGAKDSAPVAPKEAKEDGPAAPKFTLPRKKEEVAAAMPEPRQDVPQESTTSTNIDSESIFNRFKQPEPPATEEKPKMSRGFKSAAPAKPKEEDAPPIPAVKKPGKSSKDDDWDDDSQKKPAPPPAVASPAQGKKFAAPPPVPSSVKGKR